MANSQVRTANSKEFKAFKKSKTCVVLNQDPFSSFNDSIKVAMKENWTITPYEFITVEEFENRRNDSKYSFILLSEAMFEIGKNKKNAFTILNFVMGGKADYVEDMPDLGSTPMCYKEVDEEVYLYKMGTFLRFMQTFAESEASEGLKRMKLLQILDVCKEEEIQKRELWLVKEELASDINTIEKIKAIYKFPVKIATKEEINQAIRAKNDNIVFLHKVGPENPEKEGTCWKFLVTAGKGTVLLTEKHWFEKGKEDAFLLDDLKKISK